MLFTRTQAKIMKIFCSQITKSFSIRKISKLIEQGYAITHPAIQGLLKKGLLIKDEHQFLSLNYKAHFQEFAYIESLRAEDFLQKYRDISLFIDKVIKETKEFFTLLIFGSYAAGKPTRKSDVDILMIVEKNRDTEKIENHIQILSEQFTKKYHCNVITIKNVQEMLAKRDELNVINETLNNHILFFGAEDYYKQISTR